jgi:hypothetical protein
VKQRVYAHDLWVQHDPKPFEEALSEYQTNNPGLVLDVGKRRSLTIDLFRRLPEAEQQRYRQMAIDSLKTLRALQKLSGDERSAYVLSHFYDCCALD